MNAFGVAHCEEFKPKAIKIDHVVRHYKQLQNGLGKFSPDVRNPMCCCTKKTSNQNHSLFQHLIQLLESRKITAKSGALDWAESPEKTDQSAPKPVSLENRGSNFDKLFDKNVSEKELFVTLEKTKFDFGRVTNFGEAMQQASQSLFWVAEIYTITGVTTLRRFQTLNIINNTKAKVTIVWTPQRQTSESCFWVEPQVCDIPPLKAQSFRVCFKPDGFDKFFGTQLEAYSFFKVQKSSRCFFYDFLFKQLLFVKVMRDHELVTDDRCLTLPRCLNISAIGHSFTSVKDTFKGNVEISQRKIVSSAPLRLL